MYSECIVEFDKIDENNVDGENNEKGVIPYFTWNYA
jgi:hypothetical protein